MSIVNRVDLLTKERGTTFAAVERKCDLANGSIRRLDTNTPSTDKLEKVADYFNVSTDYLLGRTDIKQPDRITSALEDDEELLRFANELKEREDLQILFKQTKNLDSKGIKQIIRIIKAIEDEEDREDG